MFHPAWPGTRTSGRHARNEFARLAKIGYEVLVFSLFVRLVLDPQQPRWVDRDKSCGAVLKRVRLPAHPGDGDDTPEQAARSGGAQRNDRRGPHDRALLDEPPLAPIDLIGVRALVETPLAAHFVLEVLHRVGDESIGAGNAGFFQRRIQDAAGRADEGLAGEILLVAGLLSDQHQVRAHPAFAGHDLGGEFVERAARAFRFGGAQLRQGRDPRPFLDRRSRTHWPPRWPPRQREVNVRRLHSVRCFRRRLWEPETLPGRPRPAGHLPRVPTPAVRPPARARARTGPWSAMRPRPDKIGLALTIGSFQRPAA